MRPACAPLPAQADAEVLKWVKIDKSGLNGNIVRPSELAKLLSGGMELSMP